MNAEQLLEFIRTEAYNYEKATRQKPNTVLIYADDFHLIVDYSRGLGCIDYLMYSKLFGMYVAETHAAIFKSKPSVTHTLNLK
jgi:hypothetical protein